ncbi:MAG: DsbA family protein [Alphaproteobacteria bacterium]
MRNMLVILGVVAAAAVVGYAVYEKFGHPVAPSAPGPAASTAPRAQTPMPAAAGDRLTIALKPDDMILGSPDAKVTIVEYASLTCPHCASFHVNTLPALKAEYIDKGLVKLVYRDFPLDGLALRAAMMAQCAGPDRYFGFLDLLFARQQSWATNKEPLAGLAAVGKMGGMSEEQFQACLADKSVEQAVLADALEGDQTYAVRSTPTIFIDGQRYSGMSIEQMRAILDPLIAAK